MSFVSSSDVFNRCSWNKTVVFSNANLLRGAQTFPLRGTLSGPQAKRRTLFHLPPYAVWARPFGDPSEWDSPYSPFHLKVSPWVMDKYPPRQWDRGYCRLERQIAVSVTKYKAPTLTVSVSRWAGEAEGGEWMWAWLGLRVRSHSSCLEDKNQVSEPFLRSSVTRAQRGRAS